MQIRKRAISYKPLGNQILEIHLDSTKNQYQRQIIMFLLILFVLPAIMLPKIFKLESTIYLLFSSLTIIIFLYKISSDHIILKFNKAFDKIECIFDPDKHLIVSNIFPLSLLEKIYFIILKLLF